MNILSIFIRWIIAFLAAGAGFCLAAVVSGGSAIFIHSEIEKHFCVSFVSGACIETAPAWINSLPVFEVFFVLGAALAALLVVVCGSFGAPSRSRVVPWIFFGLGAVCALLFGMPLDGSFLLLVVFPSYASGILSALYLNRRWFKER